MNGKTRAVFFAMMIVVGGMAVAFGMALPTDAATIETGNVRSGRAYVMVGNTPTPTGTPGPNLRFCSTTPIVIPDNNPGGATGTINFPDSVTITDLNVEVSATHSWVGDLTLAISHGATNVTFYDRPGVPDSTFGCGGDNLPAVVANDEGVNGDFETSCVEDLPAYMTGGNYTNNAPLSAFDGQNTSGVWTLTVADLAGSDTGTIEQWCLDFNTTGSGPTPTPSATPTNTRTPTATPTPVPQFPDINPNPDVFVENHAAPPQITNDVMILENLGNGMLTWTITEVANTDAIRGGGCDAPVDSSWLSVAPTMGNTPGGGSTPVTLTYNSAGLPEGGYTALLCISSNDPDEPARTIPITLNVGGPTAIELRSFTGSVSGMNLITLTAAGLLFLIGTVLVLRCK